MAWEIVKKYSGPESDRNKYSEQKPGPGPWKSNGRSIKGFLILTIYMPLSMNICHHNMNQLVYEACFF